MAVALSTLAARANSAVNGPAGSFVAATAAEWTDFLANAFSFGKVHGFFTGYRVDFDTNEIVWIADPDDEDAELNDVGQQIIVIMSRVLAIEAKLLELPVGVRGKAGPAEGEITRSAQVLMSLHKTARAELAVIKSELSSQGAGTATYVIDTFLASNARLEAGDGVFVNGG